MRSKECQLAGKAARLAWKVVGAVVQKGPCARNGRSGVGTKVGRRPEPASDECWCERHRRGRISARSTPILAGARLVSNFIYFIGSVGGPIKIGISKSPSRRLIQLQTGCPHRLQILAATKGNEANERALHAQFNSARLGGEWFAPVAPLVKLVWEVAAGENVTLPSRDFDAEVSELKAITLYGHEAVVYFLKSAGVEEKVAKRAAWFLYQVVELGHVAERDTSLLPGVFPSDFARAFRQNFELTEERARKMGIAVWRACFGGVPGPRLIDA